MRDSKRFLTIRVNDAGGQGEIIGTTATVNGANKILRALATPDNQIIIVDAAELING